MTCPPLPLEITVADFLLGHIRYCKRLRPLIAVSHFDSVMHAETEEQYAEVLRTKWTLALHRVRALADLLEKSKRSCPRSLGYGNYVRKLSLPFVRDRTSGLVGWAGKDVRRIIRCCPRLLVNSDIDSAINPATIRSDNGVALTRQHKHVIAILPRVRRLSQALEVLSLGGATSRWEVRRRPYIAV
ncbi:hypothetical protein DFH11DRAFT_1878684 [Phellopilus nigrolimitatus]|nr:hypothetical protein DFH11DRAFT_1878684 [Phellopilus nigrolimitatus]